MYSVLPVLQQPDTNTPALSVECGKDKCEGCRGKPNQQSQARGGKGTKPLKLELTRRRNY